MSTKTKFKALGLAALPLLAVAVVVLVMAWGQSNTQVAHATDMTVALEVEGCATSTPNDYKCNTDTDFTVRIRVPVAPAADVGGFQTATHFDGLSYTPKAAADEILLEPESTPGIVSLYAGAGVSHSAITASPPVAATSIDPIVEMPNMQCDTAGKFTVALVAFTPGGDPANGTVFSDTAGGAIKVVVTGSESLDLDGDTTAETVDVNDSITIQCNEPPTATPSNTPTNTPSPTNTPTPTNTPASPPLFKSPSLQNLWLTRQGDKIPPTQCVGGLGSDDTAEFQFGTDTAVTGVDPKGGGKIQDVGAFEFEVHYDEQKICVELQAGLDANKMDCFIEHDANPNQSLEGVARIGCVTLGKPTIEEGVWALSLTGATLKSDGSPAPLGDVLGCLGVIQTNVGIEDFGLPATKGSQTAAFGAATDGAFPPCTGGTDSFGWIFYPGVTPTPPFVYDNDTDQLVALIPCGDNPICGGEDGSVVGKFGPNSFTGVGSINVVGLGLVNFDVNATRVARLPLEDLARVIVRPQPDVYSQAIPNQDNGVMVQLNNQKCELADLQGHAIPTFSCEDADVTIRFLEGDVEPDCEVDLLDQQAIAFRWGATKGSLFYNERFNLEPSGTQQDDDIDIKDLQFVYGRDGSTCAEPHPDQNPVNPKA